MAAEKGRHCTAFYRGGKKLFAYFLSYDNCQRKCGKAGRGSVGRRVWKKVGSRSISRVLSLDSHSSSPAVTDRLKQPTRVQRGPRQCTPIWSCSGWGLACRPHHCVRGALLPRRGFPRRLPKESTFSPLPDPSLQIFSPGQALLEKTLSPLRVTSPAIGGSALCSTFRRLATPGR